MKTAEYDQYRAEYPTQTIQGHAALYNKRFSERPGNTSFSGRAVRSFLDQCGKHPIFVAEIGGRDGGLANLALSSNLPIEKWINYEISDEPLRNPATIDTRYEGRLMPNFCWWKTTPIEGNALILSHIIEHLSDDDFKGLVASIPKNIRRVHAQAPIPMRGPMNWNGYFCSHVLTMGWVEVNEVFEAAGFKSLMAYDGASWMRP